MGSIHIHREYVRHIFILDFKNPSAGVRRVLLTINSLIS